MTNTIAIRRRYNNEVLWEGEAENMREAVTRAVLTGAVLTGADLTRAVLTGADLTGADLTGADLTPIRNDLIVAILPCPDEIPFLRNALVGGKVDGSTYQGECACLAGTMAHACRMDFEAFRDSRRMEINASSPRERWFLAIRPGHTPENHAISRITLGWIDEALAIVAKIRGTAPANE